jgi:hypothetical protein
LKCLVHVASPSVVRKDAVNYQDKRKATVRQLGLPIRRAEPPKGPDEKPSGAGYVASTGSHPAPYGFSSGPYEARLA